MAELHEDDLFRKSSMSFGDHLEELRSRLFRGALWLLFGVILGFIIGKQVVVLIESPMEKALADFQVNKTRTALLRPDGTIEPGTQQLIDEGYISEEVYIQPKVVLKDLSGKLLDQPKSKGAATTANAVSALPTNSAKPSADSAKPPSSTAKAAVDAASTAADAELLPITIWRPGSSDPRVQLQSFNAVEPFMIYLKVALLTGAIFASPMIFREIWLFVAAGLYPHERRYVYIFLPLSIGLFLAGVLMGFFVAFPIVLKFLLGFNQYLDINPQQRIEEFFNFALFLPLAFGVGFQLPLVMLFINRIGLISVEMYIKQWRIAVLAIFVIAMILMPSPDISSMALLAVPMSLLYFGGIALCKYASRRRPVGLGSE